MKLACIILISLGSALIANAREFTVLVYNVNNFFDVDGRADFGEYKQTGKNPYNSRKLLTKISNMTDVLATVAGGKGADVILFQEFEYDFTPESTVVSYEDFLSKYKGVTVDEMLTTRFNSTIAGLPVEALVLKDMADNGMEGYHVALAKGREVPKGTIMPHVNVVFSRFPIEETKVHKLQQARETVEVKLDIDGHPLYVFNNHWKSNRGGVSQTESLRVMNAHVVRKRVNEILLSDPNADIIVAGDLNCQYNQSQVHADMRQNGINGILKSQGDEALMLGNSGGSLYNLWYELDPEERFSDSYDGEFGTLMHIIVSQGLYDYRGIQYVDGSFKSVCIEGMNAQKRFRVPIRPWLSGESGGGYSDHLPLIATFKTVTEGDPLRYLKLSNPGKESPEDLKKLKVPYDQLSHENTLDARALTYVSRKELAPYYDEIFHVSAKFIKTSSSVKIGNHSFKLYSHKSSLKSKIKALPNGQTVNFYGRLAEYKGTLEFIIDHSSWIK